MAFCREPPSWLLRAVTTWTALSWCKTPLSLISSRPQAIVTCLSLGRPFPVTPAASFVFTCSHCQMPVSNNLHSEVYMLFPQWQGMLHVTLKYCRCREMVADTETDQGVGEPLDSSQTGHLVFCDRIKWKAHSPYTDTLLGLMRVCARYEHCLLVRWIQWERCQYSAVMLRFGFIKKYFKRIKEEKKGNVLL